MFIDIILADENIVTFDEFLDIDYKINSSDTNELTFCASAASLSFSVWNGDKKWNSFKFKGSVAHLYRDIERTQKIGVFNVDNVIKNKSLLNFEATDNLTKFNEIFKGIGKTNFTIWELINQICTQLGIQLRNKEEDFQHLKDFFYEDTNLILGKKCHEIINWICEVATKYAICDADGKLYFNWYNDTIKKEIPYTSLKDFARDEDLTYVSGVSCILENQEYIKGNKTSFDLVLSTDNPFLKTLNEEGRNKILDDIYSKVYGLQYLSCDIGITTDYEIQIGDTLKIFDEDNNYYKMLVTYLNINKLFSMKITSAGYNPNRTTKSSSSSGGGTGQSEKIVFAKDENYRELNIRDSKEEIHLNNIKIDGVTEKTNALLNYSFNFEYLSDNDNYIIFKIYVNDIVKQIRYKPTKGFNNFIWGEKLNLQIDPSGASISNNIKITMDLSGNELGSTIFAYAEKSVLSVTCTGATSAGANLVTNLEFKEEIQRLSLRNETSLLSLIEIEDYDINTIIKGYNQENFNDYLETIQFKKNNINILDINELIE